MAEEVDFNQPLLTPSRSMMKLPNSTRKQAPFPGMKPVMIDKPAHICMIFPIKPPGAGEPMPGQIDWGEKMGAKAMNPDRTNGKPLDAERWERIKDRDGVKGFDKTQIFSKRLFTKPEEMPGKRFMSDDDSATTTWFDGMNDDMTFTEYAQRFRELFMEWVSDATSQYDVEVELSVDNDEALLRISLPTAAETDEEGKELSSPAALSASPAALSATELRISMAVDQSAYESASKFIKEAVPDWDGTLKAPIHDQDKGKIFYPAFAPYDHDRQQHYTSRGKKLYADFKDIDLVRMIMIRMMAYFDLEELVQQEMIVCLPFVEHNFDAMSEVVECLPSLFNPIPTHGHGYINDEKIRCYLGEEVAFYFNFVVSYCRALRWPVFMSVFIVLYRTLMPHPHMDSNTTLLQLFFSIRGIEITYAFVISMWAARFCDVVRQKEQERVIRWGMSDMSGAKLICPTFRQQAEDNPWSAEGRQVTFWRIMGHTGTLLFFSLIVAGIFKIQTIRANIIDYPGNYTWVLDTVYQPLGVNTSNATGIADETAQYGSSVGSIMITIQIRVMDILWDMFARAIVRRENRRTIAEEHEALALKLYVVKLFNWSYPYVYIAFLKQHVETCEHGDCIPELRSSLQVFFTSSALIDFIFAFINWYIPHRKMTREMAKVKDASDKYTYIQVQAKLGEANMVLDDMTVFVTNFTFVCCFAFVCPMIAVYAFVYNCIMCRVYFWQRLALQKRNFPTRCAGLGIWNDLLRVSVILGCLVNTALVVFSMEPMVAWEASEKEKTFIGLEHGLLFAVAVMFSCIPDIPLRATRCGEYNDENLDLLLNPFQKQDFQATKAKRSTEAREGAVKKLHPGQFADFSA